MYPSVIMTLNISPEMKIGKLDGWNAEEFVKGTPKTYKLMVGDKEKGRLSNDDLTDMFEKKSNTPSIFS